MEHGVEHCPEKAAHEGRHTFEQARNTMQEEVNAGERSLIGKYWWLLTHIVSWWKIPYWIAEWDHQYSMKAMPESITEWSKALPVEHWSKPSTELQEESLKIQKAFSNGEDFMSYFKANISR